MLKSGWTISVPRRNNIDRGVAWRETIVVTRPLDKRYVGKEVQISYNSFCPRL